MAGTVVFIAAVSNDGGNPGATVSKVYDGSTVSGWVSSASVATNTDNFLLSPSSISDKVSNSTQTGYGLGAGVVGEPWDFSVGGADEGNHLFAGLSAAGTVDSQANGGFGIIAADDLATDSFGTWYVGPQAGDRSLWDQFAIDPTQDFDVVTAGSGSWTTTGNPAQLSGVDGMGVRWKITNTVMGASDNAFTQSGSIGAGYRITGTDAVFSEISTYEATNRYGALQTKAGILFPLCKIRIGQPSATAGNVTFDDSGFNITWLGQTLSDGTTKATADGFYGIFADEGTGTTDITLDSGNFAAEAPETFDIDFSGVNSVTCTNISADRARIVTLDGNVDWQGGTVKNSGQIDASDSIFKGMDVLNPIVAADLGAILWDSSADPDGNLDDCLIEMGATSHHAIDFGTNFDSSLVSVTLRGIDFNGFGSTDDANDSTLRFLATTGSLTLNLIDCTVDGVSPVASGGGKNFSVDDAAGMTVTVVVAPVTLLMTVTDRADDLPIQNVQTSIHLADSPFTELMNEDTTASGIASESYAGATPVDIVWKTRKSDDLDNPRYFAQSGKGEITTDGFTQAVLLEENTIIP